MTQQGVTYTQSTLSIHHVYLVHHLSTETLTITVKAKPIKTNQHQSQLISKSIEALFLSESPSSQIQENQH